MDVRLAELAPVRVDRQTAAQLDRAVRDEVLGFAAFTESELLYLRQYQRREVVVKDRGLDVGRAQAALLPELPRTERHLGNAGDRRPKERAHHVLILGCALRRGGDYRRRSLEVASPFERGNEQRLTTIGFLTAVEQMQGFDDPTRVLMIVEGDRPLVEVCSGVGASMLAIGDGDAAEVERRRAVFVHVAGREHGHPRRRCQQAERRCPRELCRAGLRAARM